MEDSRVGFRHPSSRQWRDIQIEMHRFTITPSINHFYACPKREYEGRAIHQSGWQDRTKPRSTRTLELFVSALYLTRLVYVIVVLNENRKLYLAHPTSVPVQDYAA